MQDIMADTNEPGLESEVARLRAEVARLRAAAVSVATDLDERGDRADDERRGYNASFDVGRADAFRCAAFVVEDAFGFDPHNPGEFLVAGPPAWERKPVTHECLDVWAYVPCDESDWSIVRDIQDWSGWEFGERVLGVQGWPCMVAACVRAPSPSRSRRKPVTHEWRRGTTRTGHPHMLDDNPKGYTNVVVLLGKGYTVAPWAPGGFPATRPIQPSEREESNR